MKKDIHPEFYNTKVTCACGETFTIGSTKKELGVEICSKCHPYYTGEQNVIDSTGRVERFNKMAEKSKKMTKAPTSSKKRSTPKKPEPETKQTTLKDLKTK